MIIRMLQRDYWQDYRDQSGRVAECHSLDAAILVAGEVLETGQADACKIMNQGRVVALVNWTEQEQRTLVTLREPTAECVRGGWTCAHCGWVNQHPMSVEEQEVAVCRR